MDSLLYYPEYAFITDIGPSSTEPSTPTLVESQVLPFSKGPLYDPNSDPVLPHLNCPQSPDLQAADNFHWKASRNATTRAIYCNGVDDLPMWPKLIETPVTSPSLPSLDPKDAPEITPELRQPAKDTMQVDTTVVSKLVQCTSLGRVRLDLSTSNDNHRLQRCRYFQEP